MKKMVWLLLVVPLFLFGCGAGGSGDGTSSSGDTAINDGPEVSMQAGMISVVFIPQEEAQRNLVDTTGKTEINRGRLLVFQDLQTEVIKTPIYKEEFVCYDYNATGACTDGETVQVVDYYEEETVTTYTNKYVSDKAVTAGGSVNIEVPPGDGYTLEVLGYFNDASTGLNHMLKYARTDAPFTVGNDTVTTVTLSWSAMAQLAFEGEIEGTSGDTGFPKVLAGTDYQVSFTTGGAVGESWAVRQKEVYDTTTRDTEESMWFIDDGIEEVGENVIVGTGPVTFTAPVIDYNDAPIYLMHHGQFFINERLLELDKGELAENWIFNTSDAGEVNPLGGLVITF